jgi:hypothetical protein
MALNNRQSPTHSFFNVKCFLFIFYHIYLTSNAKFNCGAAQSAVEDLVWPQAGSGCSAKRRKRRGSEPFTCLPAPSPPLSSSQLSFLYTHPGPPCRIQRTRRIRLWHTLARVCILIALPSQVRNPWGNTEWTGDYSDSSARWQFNTPAPPSSDTDSSSWNPDWGNCVCLRG